VIAVLFFIIFYFLKKERRKKENSSTLQVHWARMLCFGSVILGDGDVEGIVHLWHTGTWFKASIGRS